jgi:phosphoglucosamine mutase
MGKLFGTDGVRGVANVELTNDLAYKLGRFGANVLTKKMKKNEKARILIGKDTRVSGDMLESAMIAGILSAGCDVIKVGIVPTPAIAHLIRNFKTDAGVMISASHNPVEYNGIKFFNNEGFKLSDEIEEEIEDYILNDKDLDIKPCGISIGRKTEVYKAGDIYAEYVESIIETDLSGMSVAIDCANGAAFEVAAKTLKELGAEVHSVNAEPTGYNINDGCGSTHIEVISDIVKNGEFDLGLSFDGDADRCLAVDEKGDLIDGDKILTICGIDMKESGELSNDTIVTTVMSNIGLKEAVGSFDINSIQTKVGDRYVLEEMKAGGYVLGGEQSGHIIFLNHNTTGDGLLTGAKLLEVLKKSGKKMSELSKLMTVYPQVLKNAKVSNDKKNGYKSDLEICKKIDEVENFFHGKGRVLIRPSGTEPLVRVMIEGENVEILDKYALEIVELIENKLG